MTDPEFAGHVKTLTIYHAAWPTCTNTRSAWETHPLLLGGNERTMISTFEDHLAAAAYRAFQDFIAVQEACTVGLLVDVFDLLPNIRRVEVDHVRRWKRMKHPSYLRLRKRIWLEPHTSDSVGTTVEMVVQALRSKRAITTIHVRGMFEPPRFPLMHLPCITKVVLASLSNAGIREIQSFLACFSELKELSLGMSGRHCQIPFRLQSLYLTKLTRLELRSCCVSGQSLERFVKRNVAVTEIIAHDITIFGVKRSDLMDRIPVLTIKSLNVS
jgi:hypothetical protein